MKEQRQGSSEEDSSSTPCAAVVLLPQDLAQPFLMVATKTKREMRDAEINTEPVPARKYGPYKRESLSSEVYDVEEPLTTKTTKVYKKRRPIPNPAADNSDDSILQQQPSVAVSGKRRIQMLSDATEIPYSDVSKGEKFSECTSTPFSSSGTIILSPDHPDLNSNDCHLGPLPPTMKLASGIAFIYMAIPPDGGYGWLVVFCSFLSQLIVEGIIFSIGILLPFMEKDFEVLNGSIVLVASVQIGCYYLVGIFATALINKYGFRTVAMLGVVIASAAILVASFSSKLFMMIIFYSVIVAVGGPGLSMITVSSQLIVGFYFERYRPLVSGFCSSGAGLGIFIFNITGSMLVRRFGWQYIIRGHALLVFFVFFLTLTYSEVKPLPVAVLHQSELSTDSSDEYYGNFYVHNFLSKESSNEVPLMESYDPNKEESKAHKLKRILCPCCVKKKRQTISESPAERNYIVRTDPVQRDDLFYTGPIEYDKPHSREQFEGKELELVGSELNLQRAAYRLHNIHNYNSESDMSELLSINSYESYKAHTHPHTHTHTHRQRPIPVEDKGKRSTISKYCYCNAKVRQALGRLFDYHLLNVFEFRVLLVAAFLYPMGFNIPFLYSKYRTTIPKDYAVMISPIMGGTSFVTRCLSGVIAYKLRDWTTYVCGGGMLAGGFMVFVSAFFGSDLIWFQVCYAVSFGVASALYTVMRGNIYMMYLGLSKLTNAIGLTYLAMGIGVCVGSSFAGILLQRTGSYMTAFCFAGICIMASGVLKLILPLLIRQRARGK